jgi:hypothetical protein
MRQSWGSFWFHSISTPRTRLNLQPSVLAFSPLVSLPQSSWALFQNTANPEQQAGGVWGATFDIDPAVAGLLSEFKRADALCKFPATFRSDIIPLILVRHCVPC